MKMSRLMSSCLKGFAVGTTGSAGVVETVHLISIYPATMIPVAIVVGVGLLTAGATWLFHPDGGGSDF